MQFQLETVEQSRLALSGGAPLPGKRMIWDTFVLSSLEDVRQVMADFKTGRFGSVDIPAS
ncbi:MAG: pirin-like C-terminal cupin domain-containing protein [Acidiferrobacterales bacterium]